MPESRYLTRVEESQILGIIADKFPSLPDELKRKLLQSPTYPLSVAEWAAGHHQEHLVFNSISMLLQTDIEAIVEFDCAKPDVIENRKTIDITPAGLKDPEKAAHVAKCSCELAEAGMNVCHVLFEVWDDIKHQIPRQQRDEIQEALNRKREADNAFLAAVAGKR